jgi:hypothetical protein
MEWKEAEIKTQGNQGFHWLGLDGLGSGIIPFRKMKKPPGPDPMNYGKIE